MMRRREAHRSNVEVKLESPIAFGASCRSPFRCCGYEFKRRTFESFAFHRSADLHAELGDMFVHFKRGVGANQKARPDRSGCR